MRFFRRHSSPGFLALLAIAMQLGLVSAQKHSHSDTGWPADVGESLAAACHARRSVPVRRLPPANDRSDCPICKAVSLASLSIVQAPPALPPTPTRIAIPRPQRAVASLYGAKTVHFQARAPPIA
jgi:hypothetical protein